MKIFSLITLILFTLGIGCSYNTYYTNPQPNQYNPISSYQSVARLYIDTPTGQMSATGFAVDKDHLMTAAHFCIPALEVQIFEDNTKSIHMEYYGNNLKTEHQSGLEVEEVSDTQDLCLIKKKDHGLRPLKIAYYNDVGVGDRVWIVGAPLGVFLAEYPGRVIITKLIHNSFILNGKLIVSAASAPGISGSPVLNNKGEVIGVLVMGPAAFSHISICVPGHQLHIMINKI